MFKTTKKVLGIVTGLLALGVGVLYSASRKLSEDDEEEAHKVYEAERAAWKNRRTMPAPSQLDERPN